MQWANLPDERIVGESGFVRSVEDFENRAGVYVFLGKDFDVLYVGKAGSRRLKEEAQDALSRRKGTGAFYFLALYTNSSDKALGLEQALIKFYKPPYNGIDLRVLPAFVWVHIQPSTVEKYRYPEVCQVSEAPCSGFDQLYL